MEHEFKMLKLNVKTIKDIKSFLLGEKVGKHHFQVLKISATIITYNTKCQQQFAMVIKKLNVGFNMNALIFIYIKFSSQSSPWHFFSFSTLINSEFRFKMHNVCKNISTFNSRMFFWMEMHKNYFFHDLISLKRVWMKICRKKYFWLKLGM